MIRLAMLNLSYTLTPKLRVNLDAINRTRQKIMILNLSREKHVKLSWQAKLARTYATLSISGNSLNRSSMASVASSESIFSNNTLSKEAQEVLQIISAYDYINQYWYISDKEVKPKVIYKLHELATGTRANRFKKHTKLIRQFLSYIESGDEHPAIKAGIAQIQLRLVSPFKTHNGRITRLLSHLYLYKYGLDMRGVLVLEEQWRENLPRFKQETDVAALDKNITGWLEFYTDCMVTATEKALQKIRDDRKVVGVPTKFWDISKRQKQILSILDDPDKFITNRDVQNLFEVSQVTASRDLSDLHKKGLIFKHGDGRSVRYAKI